MYLYVLLDFILALGYLKAYLQLYPALLPADAGFLVYPSLLSLHLLAPARTCHFGILNDSDSVPLLPFGPTGGAVRRAPRCTPRAVHRVARRWSNVNLSDLVADFYFFPGFWAGNGLTEGREGF